MILIDSREQFKEQIKTKLESLHINAHVLKLENYADYVLTSDNKEVQNVVAVQRKTINEVLSQFKDIQTRLPELEEYGVPWLLVEENGIFINSSGMIMSKRGKLLYETGVKAQSYYNFLHSVQRGGTTVKTTLNWEQSVWWLYSLHSYIQREHLPKSDRKYTQKEEIMGALMSIPGVGKETTEEIWDCYCAETSKSVTNLRIDEDTLLTILVILLKPIEVKAADRSPNKEIAAAVSTAEIAKILNVTGEKKLRKLRKMLHRLTEKNGVKRKKVDGVYKYRIAAEILENEEIAALVSMIELHTQKEEKQNSIIDDDDKWLEEADALTEEMEQNDEI